MNDRILVDYQIIGWAKRNEQKIHLSYKQILYVGTPPSPGRDSSDSRLASFCKSNDCDLLTSDQRAYLPFLTECNAGEVRISLFDTGSQNVYLVKMTVSH